MQRLALLQPPVGLSGCWAPAARGYLDQPESHTGLESELRLHTLTIALWLLPSLAAAQLAPLGVPRGEMRLDVGGDFGWARDRYNDGTRESLAGGLTSPTLGVMAIPTLAEPNQRLAVLLGNSNYQLDLGPSIGNAQFSRTTGALGMALGITRQLSLYGRMTMVDAWNRQTATVDTLNAPGDAGVNLANPAIGDAGGLSVAGQFFSSFESALGTLASRIDAGDYDGDPATRALAVSTLASGQAFADSLQALVIDPATAAPFLPLLSSAAGTTLSGRVSSYQQVLSGTLGVEGFSEAIPLPTQHMIGDDLNRYATATGGPYAYRFFTSSRVTRPGDLTLGAVITPVDRWDAATSRGLRLAIDGSVQLPTGEVANAADALLTSTSDGRMALRALAALDLGWGITGVRVLGGYTARMGTTVTRRVGSPLAILVPALNTADVRPGGGNEFRLGVAPYFRLARAFGIIASADYLHRAETSFTYATAADSVPGVPASLLGDATSASRLVVGIGMGYSGVSAKRDASRVSPVDAGWQLQAVISSSSGIVTKWSAVQAWFRYYVKVW